MMIYLSLSSIIILPLPCSHLAIFLCLFKTHLYFFLSPGCSTESLHSLKKCEIGNNMWGWASLSHWVVNRCKHWACHLNYVHMNAHENGDELIVLIERNSAYFIPLCSILYHRYHRYLFFIYIYLFLSLFLVTRCDHLRGSRIKMFLACTVKGKFSIIHV